jgi:hypothetical protein
MAFKMRGFSAFTKTSDFERMVKNRKSQNKIIQESLEKKGYSFSDSEKSASRGNLNKPKGKVNIPKSNVATTKPKGKVNLPKSNVAIAKRFFKAHTPNVSTGTKKVIKKVAKKVGTRLVPFVGTVALGADIAKEIKSGGAGIKKNIKDVKKFFNKNSGTKKMITKKFKKPTKLQTMKKGNYKPQSKK